MFDKLFDEKPPLAVPESAKLVHGKIVRELETLLEQNHTHCLDPLFRERFSVILNLFDQYQYLIIDNFDKPRTCSRGCSWCCFHWVEDVNSFEAEIITDYIKSCMPEKIESIKEICEQDKECLKVLDRTIEEKVAEEKLSKDVDTVFLLLSSFFQLERPCPLLDESGSCAVYSVRPLTCRVYMSFSKPGLCRPQYINRYDIPTYILDIEEDASSIIDKLHFRYRRFADDTGLRTLLLKHLES